MLSPDTLAFDVQTEAAKLYQQGLEYEQLENWKNAVDSFTAAIALDERQAEWHYRLGMSLKHMSLWHHAAVAFEKAVLINATSPSYFYHLGISYERQRLWQKANAAFCMALLLKKTPSAGWLYHQGLAQEKLGMFSKAAASYAEAISRSPDKALWHFRLGMAYDRQYLWKDAATAYAKAIELDPQNAKFLHRMGYILERQKSWDESASFYKRAFAAENQTEQSSAYRLGYVLAKARKYKEACEHFLMVWRTSPHTVLSQNPCGVFPLETANFAATHWFAMGDAYSSENNWPEAQAAYQKAVDRNFWQDPEWFLVLGHAYAQTGNYEEAADAFLRISFFQRPYGINIAKTFKENKAWGPSLYLEYYENAPIKSKTIFYQPFCKSIVDSPGAIFTYLLDQDTYGDFTHVYVVDDASLVPKELITHPRIIIVKQNTPLYFYYLATAEYIIHNAKFPSYWIRREEQKYLNTWHGTPLKRIGRHVNSSISGYQKVARNFLQATHILSPNEATSKILLDAYGVESIYSGLYGETGYPRVDTLINASEDDKNRLKAKLGVQSNNKVLMYAPTWRKDEEGAALFTAETFASVWKNISQLDVTLVFRGHFHQNKILRESNFPVVIAGQEIDSCEVMSIVDVLITDYSSIFYDFIPMKKPIVFYVPDYEEYGKKQGFYFDFEDMPGSKCKTPDELFSTIQNIISEQYVPDKKHIKALTTFNTWDDGHATERAVSFFFNNSADNIQNYADSNQAVPLCCLGGGAPGKNTDFLISFLSTAAKRSSGVGVLGDSKSMLKQSTSFETGLTADAYVLAERKEMLGTPEEKWLAKNMSCESRERHSPIYALMRECYQREFVRLFGHGTRFSSLILFDSVSPYWTNFIAAQPEKYGPKILCLPEDVEGPSDAILDNLREVLPFYPTFDYFVSLSGVNTATTCDILTKHYHVPFNKFITCVTAEDIFRLVSKAC